MTTCIHPDYETLRRFALGRLDRKVKARVEGHLRGCLHCGNLAVQVPDDRLVELLRVSTAGFAPEPPADETAGLWRSQFPGLFQTSSARKSTGKLGLPVVLGCLAGVAGSSISGCSRGAETSDLSPTAQAKSKESFKKRSGDAGEKTKDRKPSR
jgi:hypothetical protein